ncbi:MAG: hypothetical protein H7249_18110 [Chitinophagaceae bacterium]|nr:hypothetical protein [Oligoflexus sp.]
MKLFQLILFLALNLMLLACGQPVQKVTAGTSLGAAILSSDPDTIEKLLLAHFQFSDTLDAEAKTNIQYDLKNLAHWSDTTRSSELSKLGAVLGLAEVNAGTLSQWLMDRVTYIYPITGNTFEIGVVKSSTKKVQLLHEPTPPLGAGIVANNLGPQIYTGYSDNKTKGFDSLVFKFDSGYQAFTSLRTGVMLINPADFHSALNTGTTETEGDRIYRSIFRLNALFHEARHSDGNAAANTLGLLHPVCVDNGKVPKEVVGLAACDAQSNGAYTVGARVIGGLMGLCDGKCSESQKTALQGQALMYLSVVNVDDTSANYANTNPEPMLPKFDVSAFQFSP